jgi:hypothetical protein
MLRWVQGNYFFRVSRYQAEIEELLTRGGAQDSFVQPASRRNEVGRDVVLAPTVQQALHILACAATVDPLELRITGFALLLLRLFKLCDTHLGSGCLPGCSC